MTINLDPLKNTSKLLFAIELRPLQGNRFQPTGFPSLGAATFQTSKGTGLLVESPQSMANRLELAGWDEAAAAPKAVLNGISYVRVERDFAVEKDGKKTKEKRYLTSSITEAHRINSPYMLEGKDKTFFDRIKAELGVLAEGPINRKLLAEVLLKYDAGCLLHGVFLAKKELAGGRLRMARALSAFIEAEGVRQAISGGVKNDLVNPSGSAKDGFGNVPFSREEYTADKITLYVNLDLAQIRGYGLGQDVERMLILLAIYKLRAFLDGDLRLRTACSFEVKDPAAISATKPVEFVLPKLAEIESELKGAITVCNSKMEVTTVIFNDDLKSAKGAAEKDGEANSETGDDNGEA